MKPEELEEFQRAAEQAPSPVVMAVFGIGMLALLIFFIVCFWRIFTKAGEPGWASIVPIYNLVVLLKIAGKPLWWVLLMLIPFVNFVIAIIAYIGLAERFGKTAGFGIGLALLTPIFAPILAFGDAQYVGPKTA